ncbi:MAG: DNA-directed RNA polymerase subunit A' [Candidatus Micrarchaeia archaeon]
MAIEKMIEKIKFSLFSPEMIRKISVAKITIPDTYNEDGYPIDGGLVDQRLGVIDPGLRCKTCGGRIRDCSGHFGHTELVRPVIHPEFARVIFLLLKATCFSCHRILLPKRQIEHLKSVSEEEQLSLLEKSRKVSKCPHCGAKQPNIKFERPTTFQADGKMLLPTDIRDHLEKIPSEDLKILGIDPEYARPEWMVLTALLVPPVTVRPSITLETGERSEDDLTHKLVDIMRINQRLEANINAGAPQLIIEDLWELLQYHVTTYFNNETANIPPARHRSGRPLKTLSQRLKGKEGRFRYNLSGKRVNFSARTVISPDPNISINEVGVPRAVAEELTVPIKVTDWNIEECKKLIMRTEPPLAVYLVRPDGKRKKITDKTREEVLNEVVPGCTIERQLQNGDTVLFNRQPSLHRLSIMCHNVRIMNGRSFRLNLAVCPPYNADFDGDEMNLHVPQTEEARVEAELLMKVQDQIISPRHGHAIIKPHEDHVSGVYFLTKKDAYFDKKDACQIAAIVGKYELPEPERNGKYSGKKLFSMLLHPEINLETKTKMCMYGKKCTKCVKKDCPYDAYVVIKNGQLEAGTIDSKVFGNELVERMMLISSDAARDFIDKATRVSLYVVTRHGFSVTLSDYHISKNASEKIEKIEEKARKEVEALVLKYKNKTLERTPGRTLRETLEERAMEVLGKARTACGEVVEEDLSPENSAILMARTGARGSILNVIQMACMLGQQSIRSKRISRGYFKRALHHFKRGDLGAYARGFIPSCFTEGLTPIDYFFHSVGGRESLVNTAIRTARSGYMQRRLINALQDFVVRSDLSVRDARNMIAQFRYGGDGVDPQRDMKIGELITDHERE